jgi:hypothetical protein
MAISLRHSAIGMTTVFLVVFLPAIGALKGASAQAEPAAVKSSTAIDLSGASWRLAPDPKNVGRNEKWYNGPVPAAKPVAVPCVIEEVFTGYHGVAWYWREFTAPANPHPNGRYLLRFWNVDYLADVWLNGVYVGRHKGAFDPFVLDATAAVKPDAVNRLAVRVVNPTNTPVDGITLADTAHTSKHDGGFNWGGIMDAVELIVAPAVRVEDLFVRPDPKTGRIRVQANLRNVGKQAVPGKVVLTVAPAKGGETLDVVPLDRQLPPGDTRIETELKVQNPRLWELNDPYLYRVTVRVGTNAATSFDEQSTRCGFRDFRCQDGFFRLNGRRIFLKSAHSCGDTPVVLTVARDPSMTRHDMLNLKAMGFNMVRFLTGMSHRFQIDLCDEIGLLVYHENFASWCMSPSPKMAEEFNRSTLAMVKRDRNHASVVMWGLLNETGKDPIFDHAVTVLPLVQTMDDTRMVLLDSGGFTFANTELAFANPGSTQWETSFTDQHPYQPQPHNAAVIRALRTAGGQKSLFLSEYGVYSAMNLARIARHFEQLGKTSSWDAVVYRRLLDRFMGDWQRWNLGDTFANPEDYFQQCVAWIAGVRKLGTSAIRANPNTIGHSVTDGQGDPVFAGEGLAATTFRELKPGVIDAMFDAWYPLRWCLFVEPVQVYRGRKARVEAVLANEDVLAPGDYPVRFQIVGPNNVRMFDRTVTVKIPDPKSKPEPRFALPLFAEDVVIDGPSGKYRFLATFERGGAAAGGEVEFYVADAADMPAVTTDVALWGEDVELGKWLTAHGIKNHPFVSYTQPAGEVILVGNRAAKGESEAFRALARHIARGSNAVFLCPGVFKRGNDTTAWLPLANKGAWIEMPMFFIRKDDWTKNHPVFEGLQAGGIMDHTFYREVVPTVAWSGQDALAEAVAGSINTSSADYASGLTVSVHRLGAGRFTLNALRIRENLGIDPVAERLLRNMLRYAARDVEKRPVELPAGFDEQLKAMKY